MQLTLIPLSYYHPLVNTGATQERLTVPTRKITGEAHRLTSPTKYLTEIPVDDNNLPRNGNTTDHRHGKLYS